VGQRGAGGVSASGRRAHAPWQDGRWTGGWAAGRRRIPRPSAAHLALNAQVAALLVAGLGKGWAREAGWQSEAYCILARGECGAARGGGRGRAHAGCGPVCARRAARPVPRAAAPTRARPRARRAAHPP
jgi:hypothetical protein